MREPALELSILEFLTGEVFDDRQYLDFDLIYNKVMMSEPIIKQVIGTVRKRSHAGRIRLALDAMTLHGLVETHVNDSGGPTLYRAADRQIYEASSDAKESDIPFKQPAEDGIRVEQSLDAGWAQLAQVKIDHKNAAVISLLIGKAIDSLKGENNIEIAQARTLLLAARDLTEAPEPPSRLIWEMIQRAGSAAGLLDIFYRIFSAVF